MNGASMESPPATGKRISDRELKLWDKLDMEFFDGEQSGQYVARIEDIRAEGLIISRPDWLKGEPLFAEGAACLITYYRKICAYQFGSRVVRSMTENKKLLYVLAPPVTIKRLQRRRLVRVDFTTPFQFVDISEVENSGGHLDLLQWEKATTLNLSAGGIGCQFSREMDKGTVLALRLTLNGLGRTFETLGRIARCASDGDTGRFYVGIELFTREEMTPRLHNVNLSMIPDSLKQFSEWERNMLINFIFNEEIKIRRKETVEEGMQ
jgi:c-di-GMP-binding flagellar brake protein YcgR